MCSSTGDVVPLPVVGDVTGAPVDVGVRRDAVVAGVMQWLQAQEAVHSKAYRG